MNKLFYGINKIGRFSLGISLILLSLLATIASTAISIFCYSDSISDDTQSLIVKAFIIILQLVVFIGSISKSTIIKYNPQNYRLLDRFTKFCFLLSVLSTITYFNQFDKLARMEVIKDILNIIPLVNLDNNIWLVENLTNITLIWLSAFILDMISMYFPSLGADLITDNKVKNTITEETLFSKLIYILTFAPTNFINQRYSELKELEKIPNKKNLTKEIVKIENDKSKDKEIVRIESKDNSKDKEIVRIESKDFDSKVRINQNNLTSESLDITNVKPVKINNKSNVINLNKEIVRTKSKDKKPKVRIEKLGFTNEKLGFTNEKLRLDIENYINENYKPDETLKTKSLKKHFSLTDNEWKKIKNDIRNIETFGTKTKIISLKGSESNV